MEDVVKTIYLSSRFPRRLLASQLDGFRTAPGAHEPPFEIDQSKFVTETGGEERGVQVRGAAATATLKTEQARPNDKLSQLHKTLHLDVKKMSHELEDVQAAARV